MGRRYARIGEIIYSTINDDDDLYAVALGSCVAVVIYDPIIKASALAHIALPDRRNPPKTTNHQNFELPGRYADTAVPEMLDQLKKIGGLQHRLKAKIAGGANIFGSRGILMGSILNIGERNAKRVVELLDEYNIPLLGQDLGGDAARTVIFNTDTQRMTITNSEYETKRIL